VYLALHGSYSIIWVAKDHIFPDPKFDQPQTLAAHLFSIFILWGYWIPGYLLISTRATPGNLRIWASILLYILGVSIMLVADCQKYYTLKHRRGLITDGMFARTRNPNYIGEMMLYSSFSLLSGQWKSLPFLFSMWASIFLPNMLQKDMSLSRYAEWPKYLARTGLLLPRLTPPRSRDSQSR